uniref:AlNc14C185G8313 protein n=1 Tax=Albugo laibachii Nc14 TaxID=890382 RepID=F0WPG8_9STRA|nr:AlNc14C185G8313 [Albugo laibachii Nc14]|eukprot:CCA23216.1 AlNc14C185G8313 [Albugo laibachii Nc14]
MCSKCCCINRNWPLARAGDRNGGLVSHLQHSLIVSTLNLVLTIIWKYFHHVSIKCWYT